MVELDQRKVGERLELVVEDQEPGNPTAIWAQPVIFHDATKCSSTGHSNCNVFGDDAAFKCTTGNANKAPTAITGLRQTDGRKT